VWPLLVVLFLFKWGFIAIGWGAAIGLAVGSFIMAKAHQAKEAVIMVLAASVIALILS
jgi:hypothetical protein